MKRLFTAGALVLALAACSDGGTSSPKLVSVKITPRDQTIAPGATLQLSAATTDDAGGSQPNVSATWQSLTPGVATVSATGLLTAVGTGTAKVTATVRDRADTATYTVAAAPSTCVNGTVMGVGESTTVSGSAATTLCLPGGATGAEYLVMPRYTAPVGETFLSLNVGAQGTVAATGFSPDRLPSSALYRSGDEGLQRDYHWDAVLRGREHELRGRVPAAQAAFRQMREESEAPVQGGHRSRSSSAVIVGDILPLNASLSACTSPSIRYGRVVSVGTHSIVVADTANPAGGMTDAEYAQFGAAFDTLAWPVDTAAFGTPGDLDGNGRVIIFYTKAVNEMTPANSSSYVGGFFYARDLFPKTATPSAQACAGSNYAEMFYMLVADPNGVVNGNKRTKDLITKTSVATLAHEFQHLISASRRLYVLNTGNYDEDVWLNEGLSHIAEELTFYRAAGLAPRANLTVPALQTSSRAVNAFNTYNLSNTNRYHAYLVSADANSPYDGNDNGDDVETRGAIWAFLRYAADRKNGDDQALWFNLVNNTRLGMDNLSTALGVDATVWMRDWQASVYLDDTAAGTQARYQQPSWNFRNLINTLYGVTTYPLQAHSLAQPTTNVNLATGAASFDKIDIRKAK